MSMKDIIRYAIEVGCGARMNGFNRQVNNRLASRNSTIVDSVANHGSWQLSSLLNRFPEKEALALLDSLPQTDQVNIKTQVTLEVLGEYLAKAAATCLPIRFQQAAKRWNKMTVKDQRSTLLALYRFACYHGSPYDRSEVSQGISPWVLYYLNQEPDSVLPYALKHRKGKRQKPNCVGTTSLVLGFAYLAKAKVFSFQPIVDAGEQILKVKLTLYRRIYHYMRARGYKPAYFTYRKLNALIKEAGSLIHRPEMPHLGTVFVLKDGQYFWLDPYSLQRGIVENKESLSRAVALLDQYHTAVPGLTLTVTDDNWLLSILHIFRMEALSAINVASRATCWMRKPTVQNIKNAVFDIWYSRMVEYLFVDVLHGERSTIIGADACRRDRHGRISKRKDLFRTRTEAIIAILCNLETHLIEKSSGDNGTPVVVRPVMRNLIRPLRWLGKQFPLWALVRLDKLHFAPTVKSPVVELGDPQVLLAVTVLRHLGVFQNKTAAVGDYLAQNCSLQFHQVSFLTRFLRKESVSKNMVADAFDFLRHQPWLMRTSYQRLKTLRQRFIKSQERRQSSVRYSTTTERPAQSARCLY